MRMTATDAIPLPPTPQPLQRQTVLKELRYSESEKQCKILMKQVRNLKTSATTLTQRTTKELSNKPVHWLGITLTLKNQVGFSENKIIFVKEVKNARHLDERECQAVKLNIPRETMQNTTHRTIELKSRTIERATEAQRNLNFRVEPKWMHIGRKKFRDDRNEIPDSGRS